MQQKTVRFIVNPISGGINKERVPELVEKSLDHSRFTYQILFSESAQHMATLCQNAVNDGINILAAVGGDGTVNYAAKAVCNSNTALAIVPMGSGNGLARHLRIPTNPKQAIQIINLEHYKSIDSGMANETFFINVAGAGFDAHVSHKFATAPKRGFMSYAQITLNEFAKYQHTEFELVVDKKMMKQKAFLICIGNGSQYGNNAYITPSANESDGKFEMSILKPFRMIDMPAIAFELFAKKFSNSKFVDTFSASELLIKRDCEGVFNIDGEPVMMEKDVLIRMLPKSVKVMIP
jgi:diacylglycerol kinase (ATP)